MEVKYYRTNVDGRKPNANNMEYGEIAVNYNSTNPRLMIKDSNDAIASFLPESYINEEFKQIDGDLNEIGKNVSANTASIDALEAWVNEPLTDDEIAEIFAIPSIKATYNVTSTSEPTKLAYSALPVKKVKIDGVTIECDSIQSYTFDSVGEHTVEYTFTDNTVRNSAFSGCTNLTNVIIGELVTSIGDSAFYGCSGLTSVTIGSGVTSIEGYAFSDCTGLTSIVIPDSVTSIGEGAFIYCSGLTSVTIGSGVTSIGEGAFYDCSGLTSITSYAVTAPTIGSFTFRNVKSGGTLYVPEGSTDSYSTWMGIGLYYLGYYNWTIEEMG